MKSGIKLLIILIGLCIASAQSQNYAWPIDSPRVLTGNYGELRPQHFHTGLDFSTNGKINYPVYSIEDGYVSRVKVSSVGYGRCLYVTHKDGKVTLYAHLNSYNQKIAAAVKKEQYAKQNYEVEFFPKPNEFPVKRREQLGLSGNTGGSTGPHLHFEIRDGQTETPLNPLEYFHIDDTVAPVIQNVAFYNLADTCSPKFLNAFPVVKGKNGIYKLKKDSVVLRYGILGFAFEGFDRFTAKGSPNNIFNAKLFYDGRHIYGHTLNNIHFSDQRFVNEFCENVEVSKKEKYKMQKCFVPTLFPPNLYDTYRNKGRILIVDTNWHSVKLAVHDENGNESVLEFTFKTRKLNYYSKPSINSDIYADCTEDFMIAKNKLQIFIPAYTLYYSTGLIFENTIESTGKLIILPTDANLRTTSIVGFEVPAKYRRIKNKLVLKSGDNVLSPIVHNDSVFYSVKNLGWFLLDQDTIAPKIKTQLAPTQLKKMKKLDSFAFVVSDNLSGVWKYNMTMNGKWILGEYDAKSGVINYTFDDDTPKSGPLTFRLEVEDRVGNKNALEYTVKR